MNDFYNTINDSISLKYTEDIIFRELIELSKSNKYPIVRNLLINHIIDVCIRNDNLIHNYELLKLTISNKETLEKLQINTHNKSVYIFYKLMNDNNEYININTRKKISHSISNILNTKCYTKKDESYTKKLL
jgi:hypothetical protein